jgi:hypothetical protein
MTNTNVIRNVTNPVQTPVPLEGVKEFRTFSNYPLTRSAVRRTTLSPMGARELSRVLLSPRPGTRSAGLAGAAPAGERGHGAVPIHLDSFFSHVSFGQRSFEKIGRASLLASRGPSKSLPHEVGGSLALPISAGFEFFHSFPLARGGPGDWPFRGGCRALMLRIIYVWKRDLLNQEPLI